MQTKKHLILFVLLLTCLLAGTAFAQGLKARIKARQPAIKALLIEGVVGENNQGYLEFRAAPKQADVVKAENADRKQVYIAIAKKTGATSVLVGQHRAARLAAILPAGVWIQNSNGKWHKKK